ncbi:UNVERIFIED_CONTAM: hypothetical protein GTU68_051913 [Idotea baltica]|nr:hypothetical protein [Idotea baltica]
MHLLCVVFLSLLSIFLMNLSTV